MSNKTALVIFRVLERQDKPGSYVVGVCRPGNTKQHWYDEGRKLTGTPLMTSSGASGRIVHGRQERDAAQTTIGRETFNVRFADGYRLVDVVRDLSTIRIEKITPVTVATAK